MAREHSRAKGAKVLSIMVLAMNVAVLLGIVALAYFVMPRFVKLFEDMDVALPALTTWALRAVSTPLPAAGAALVIAGLVVKEFFLPSRVNLAINSAAMVLVGAGVLLLILALFLPMYGVVNEVGSG